jgi:hypothetical protein
VESGVPKRQTAGLINCSDVSMHVTQARQNMQAANFSCASASACTNTHAVCKNALLCTIVTVSKRC